jgi:hypothetical protein
VTQGGELQHALAHYYHQARPGHHSPTPKSRRLPFSSPFPSRHVTPHRTPRPTGLPTRLPRRHAGPYALRPHRVIVTGSSTRVAARGRSPRHFLYSRNRTRAAARAGGARRRRATTPPGPPPPTPVGGRDQERDPDKHRLLQSLLRL